MKENEDIRKAKEELEKIRQNEKDIRLAELRMKYILDQNWARNSGFREGIVEGKREIAKRLISLKMPIEQIIEVTGLTEKEIKSIQ